MDGNAAVTIPLDQMVMREALRRGPVVPDRHDLIAWAPRFGDGGGILRDCAALIGGAPEDASPASSAAGSDWTLEIAIAELLSVARQVTPRLVAADRPGPSGRPDNPLGIGPGIPARDIPDDMGAIVRELTAMFAQAEPDTAAMADRLDSLAEIARRLPALDYRRLCDAPTDLLLSAIVATVLADFVLRTRDLAGEPLGSMALLHRSARFSTAGLGPWFSNVGRLVRNSYDVFDLARRASAAAEHDDERTVGAWIALLSRGCDGWLLRHLVDDLADYGAMAPLLLILDRTLSRSAAAVDIDLVMYLRDAALDNADHCMAAHAQAAIVRLRPDSLLEQEILGTIQASGGDHRAADATFRAALVRDPAHGGIRARLEALGTSAFEPFLIEQGFGSPVDRAHVRLHRRGVVSRHERRQGERIAAVDVR
jgi:hypothetical protein